MSFTSIPRTTVDTSLRLVKLPLDRGASFAGLGAQIAVDRLDAAVRDFAGLILFDQELRRDAALRRTAADEREKALRTAAKAEETRNEAKSERERREQQALEAERRRKAAARDKATREREASESKARRERLETLEAKSEALDEREEAATAADEAHRLKQSAAAVKAKRTADKS